MRSIVALWMVVVGSASGLTAYDAVTAAGSEIAAGASFQSVHTNATWLVTVDPALAWSAALEESTTNMLHGDGVTTVSGTTVTWKLGDACFVAEMPGPFAPYDTASC